MKGHTVTIVAFFSGFILALLVGSALLFGAPKPACEEALDYADRQSELFGEALQVISDMDLDGVGEVSGKVARNSDLYTSARERCLG